MEFIRIYHNVHHSFSDSTSVDTARDIENNTQFQCFRTGACYNFYINGKVIENNQPLHYIFTSRDKFYGTLGALVFELEFQKQQSGVYTIVQNPNKSLMIGVIS